MTNNTSVSVSVAGAFLVMAIIDLVFLFDSYSDFRHDYYKEWIYFVIWGITCLVPIANEILDIFNKINLFKLVGIVLFGMWIWGWIIMCSDNWSGIRKDYRPLSNLLISFQIISIFEAYGTYKIIDEDEKPITIAENIV